MRKQISATESVGTLARGLDVLELLAEEGPELSQTEIATSLGLPLPTVHRLCAVLSERGFLERDPASRRFRLGMQVARLVPALLAGLGLPEVARGQLRRLASTTGETVNLGVRQEADVVYLVSEAGARLLAPRATVGLRLPLHCTALGKCLLAQLSDAEARAAIGPGPYERRTAFTLTSWPTIQAALEEVREAGVAISREEYEEGLASYAVPVAWPEGPAALNISLPTARATEAFREQYVPLLLEAADAIAAGAALHGG
jgi:IclR family acetate operon transcriptional repressor